MTSGAAFADFCTFRGHQRRKLLSPLAEVSPQIASTEAAMDSTAFHEVMQHKYAEHQWRHHRLVRIWILCGMAPVALLLSFVLAYIWYSGK